MEAQVKKEDRRVRRTKKLLTQALTELMQQKQVKEITVTELTDLADMNRGTFYLYYKDIFDMLEHIEDNMFQALNEILERHEKENVVQETEPILRDILGFIEENQEMVRVLLSPHGDMNFLHRLNDVLREKCLQFVRRVAPNEGEASFDYQYSVVIFGTAGLIRAWVNRNCAESTAEIAQMAGRMIRTGSLA
jgi:AcrR family transcriptional regulator